MENISGDKIILSEATIKNKSFEPDKVYSDEFYESFASEFVQNKKKRYFYRFVKRAFDITMSFFALLLLALPMIIISIWIKCDSKGPVFFKQKRIGKGGKEFNCLKFRTMYTSAPRNSATAELKDSKKHITRSGRILRKLSLDELPQFICTFIGTMSIIGYRPILPNEVECNSLRERLGVFTVRPGISGFTQIHGRDKVTPKNKAIMDAYYVKNASLWLDFKLVFSTVAFVLGQKDVVEGKQEQKTKQETEKA